MTDIAEIKRRKARYDETLLEPEGDGSLVGRYFIIAKSRGTDIDDLLARCEELAEAAEATLPLIHDLQNGFHTEDERACRALHSALDNLKEQK